MNEEWRSDPYLSSQGRKISHGTLGEQLVEIIRGRKIITQIFAGTTWPFMVYYYRSCVENQGLSIQFFLWATRDDEIWIRLVVAVSENHAQKLGKKYARSPDFFELKVA